MSEFKNPVLFDYPLPEAKSGPPPIPPLPPMGKPSMIPPFVPKAPPIPTTTPEATAAPAEAPERLTTRDYLVTFGMLTVGCRVLLPRQVLPFSRGWSVLSADLQYYRWQMMMHPVRKSDVQPAQIVLAPNKARSNPLLAHQRSYGVCVRQDGPAGFCGQYMRVGKQLTLADAERLSERLSDQVLKHHSADSYPDSDPVQSIAALLPVFYVELDSAETDKWIQKSKTMDTSLRQVFDLTTGRWKWLYQLGHGTISPVVFSERGERGTPPLPEVSVVHNAFASRNFCNTIYIGGCGIVNRSAPEDSDDSELTEVQKKAVMSDDAVYGPRFLQGELENKLKLKAAVFVLSGESPEVSRETSKGNHDSLGDYIRRVVNGPAMSMVRRVKGEPDLIGL